MPKNMFFNISEEKRKMFLRVATEEFTTKPFEDCSVNSIIKKANISRGSFYTYFDNLESLFEYLLTSLREERFSYGKQIINRAKGNFFEFVRQLFLYDYDAYQTQGVYSLFRNYIHYIQSVKKGSLKDTLIKDSLGYFSAGNKSITEVFNISSTNMSEADFIDLIEVVIILMVNTYLKSENEHMTKEEVINLFNKRLKLLEYGIYK